MKKWILKWRGGRLRGSNREEYPRIELATAYEIKHGMGHESKHEAIERTLVSTKKRLEEARQSVIANERYVEQLEALLAKAQGK